MNEPLIREATEDLYRLSADIGVYNYILKVAATDEQIRAIHERIISVLKKLREAEQL